MPTDKPSGPSQGRREVAMRVIQMVRHLTDFPLHKYAAHVITKTWDPATRKFRREGEQWRFRLQIRRIVGRNVDLGRLFERLRPARWNGDAISDAFWTFFMRGVYGRDAVAPVEVKRELVRKEGDTFLLNDDFFPARRLDRQRFVDALNRCVRDPEGTFPAWIRAEGWHDVLEGERPPSEYDLPPIPAEKPKPNATANATWTATATRTRSSPARRGRRSDPPAVRDRSPSTRADSDDLDDIDDDIDHVIDDLDDLEDFDGEARFFGASPGGGLRDPTGSLAAGACALAEALRAGAFDVAVDALRGVIQHARNADEDALLDANVQSEMETAFEMYAGGPFGGDASDDVGEIVSSADLTEFSQLFDELLRPLEGADSLDPGMVEAELGPTPLGCLA